MFCVIIQKYLPKDTCIFPCLFTPPFWRVRVEISEAFPLSSLIVGVKDIKSEEFQVEIIKWIDESRPGFDRMIVHPLELGNILEFRNKSDSNFSGKGFNLLNVVGVNKQTQTKKGFLSKKEDIILEILFSNDRSSTPDLSIIVNIEDKQAAAIIDRIEKSKNLNQADKWQPLTFPVSVEGNSVQNINLFPSAPFLAEGEQVLWKSLRTDGIIRTHVVFVTALTNYRIFQYDFKNHDSGYATMGAIDDIVVTNQHRVSQSSGSGTYSGVRLGSMRTGYGNTRTRSSGVTIGDVLFMHEGKPAVSILQIEDPHGLARLAKSAKKQYAVIEKALKKIKTENTSVVCSRCGLSNIGGANFCNGCGNALA